MINAIKSTLWRLCGKIYLFNPITWLPLLLEGIAIEFDRIREYKNIVLSSTVPNDNMSPYCVDDYNTKYGIPNTLPGTDAEKIARIIEKAALNGEPGADWLQDQLQKAGFMLYAIENEPLDINIVQYSTTIQYSVSQQYGLTQRFVNPDDIDGDLIVGSTPIGAGRIFLYRYGICQYTELNTYGTYDQNALNPQPFIYVRTDDPKYWGFYFTLSPFSNRVAIDESEFLVLSQDEYNYLVLLIKQLKLQRNWCILQAKTA
jgi:hypothetical protein